MLRSCARMRVHAHDARVAPCVRSFSTPSGPPSPPRAPPRKLGKDGKLFDKILIANRGEISCRISRTAHKLGIATVALYSDPDASAIHVTAADEAICVGPAPSTASYLNIDRVLEAVERSGAQAVHPGYGFLSEKSKFVAELESRGVVFIGPNAYAMDALGEKIHSKKLAMAAGVNTVPGHLADIVDAEEAVQVARRIGYPVMVKASSGGGGKGMRVAYNDEETRMGYRLSKEEAKSAFASDEVFIEKFIEEPRHIEVQLIADCWGNVVALPERECTIQRRNQKVIEESPSVLLDDATRAAMQAQACSLARSVGYNSAGTVEFLVDAKKNFYFLEMNTRLQVEHPVTEAITGVDLVELMLRSAAGERLPEDLIKHGGKRINGHAFESRVYAEDPLRGFLPSTGRLSGYVEPASFAARDPFIAATTLRCDAGVQHGSEISMWYDPMIAKLITHAPTRAQALDAMTGALDDYVIRGVNHNIPFLRDLTTHPRFKSGRIDTSFIKVEYPDGFSGVKLDAAGVHNAVASAAIMHALRAVAAMDVSGASPHARMPNVMQVMVTLGRPSAVEGAAAVSTVPSYSVKLNAIEADAGDAAAAVDAATLARVPEGDNMLWTVDITPVDAAARPTGPTTTVRLANVDWSVDSPLFLAAVVGAKMTPSDGSHAVLRVQQLAKHAEGFKLYIGGASVDAYVRSPHNFALAQHMLPFRRRDMTRVLVSPMPGSLISLAVAAGQEVEEGQEVAVVEAMKMQNVLRAPKKGVVKAVKARAGETLMLDQVIVEFE